jgi:predicted nucleic-acid-binding protein
MGRSHCRDVSQGLALIPVKAIDTNLLVRALARDDPAQTAVADREIEDDVFIATSVLMETEWVLRSRYKWPRADVNRALSGLVEFANVFVEDEELVRTALSGHALGQDLADMIHIGAARRAEEFVTFDARLARLDEWSGLTIRLA